MVRGTFKEIGKIVILLIGIQILLFALKQGFFVFLPRTDLSDHMASCVAMSILSIAMIILAKKRKEELALFPQKFSRAYIAFTVLFIILYILTPSNRDGIQSAAILLYGCTVLPFFEETIFRGYVWKKLETVVHNKWLVYILTTVLFGFWHLGYIDSILFRVHENIMNIMFWKVIIGFCFGITTGFMRMKTKNYYSAILIHGIMNMFAR